MFRVRAFLVLAVAALLVAVLVGGTETTSTLTVAPGDSLQEAVDAAPLGAVILLAAGEWHERLDITKPLTLRGAGETATILYLVQGEDVAIHVGSSDQDDGLVVLEGLEIRTGEAMCDGPESAGIRVVDTARARIVGCTVLGEKLRGAWHGVAVAGSAEAEIADCVVAQLLVGIGIVGEAEAVITGSAFSECALAVGASGASRVSLECCVAEGRNPEPSTFVQVHDTAQASISDCTFSSVTYGILAASSAEARADDVTGTAVLCAVALNESARAWIRDCELTGEFTGIHLGDAVRAEILACCVSNGRIGVALEGSAEALIADCELCGNETFGVALSECYSLYGEFTGWVSGRDNRIPGPGEEDGNREGAFCPETLHFLTDTEGGQLDCRQQEE